jgi:hypothetical protein
MVSARDLFSGNDVPAQAELLLNLLNDAAAGRDVSGLVSEVAEVRRGAGAVSGLSRAARRPANPLPRAAEP